MATLYLIPTTLAANIDHHVLLPQQLESIKHLRHFVVETAKIGRQHLKALSLTTPLQQLSIKELNKHHQVDKELLAPLLAGEDMGLLSDCGLPAIADPGSQLVALAHQHNIQVSPLVGASSLLLALMASGVNGQCFAFQGYLPIKAQEQEQKILHLQQLVLTQSQSQIIIETPFRNQQLLTTLVALLRDDITLCVALNLMQPEERIYSQKIAKWRAMPTTQLPVLHKQEVVFVVGQ